MMGPYLENHDRTASAPLARTGVGVRVTDSDAMVLRADATGTGTGALGNLVRTFARPVRPCGDLLGRRRLRDLRVERRKSLLDHVQAVIGESGVAVLVDAVGADHALAVLRGQDRVHDGLAGRLDVTAELRLRALQRVQAEGHRLVSVDGVRVDGLGLVLRLEAVDDLGRLRELLGAQGGHRELDPLADVGRHAALGRIGERLLRDAVRAVELGLGRRRGDVLEHLHAVLTGDARPEEAVALDLRRDGAVVRRVAVRALAVLDRQAGGLRRALDVPGEAGAVGGLVVPQRDGLAAVVLHDGDQRRALDLVARHDARVRALAGRVVLVRLARLGARLVRGQAAIGVGRADLRDAGLVEDRQGHLRAAGVELAQIRDRGLVADRLARVLRRLALVRRTRVLRGRVVERDVLQLDLADLGARVLERQLLAVDDRERLASRRTLERQARVDGELVGAARATTASAAPSARRRTQREYGDGAARSCKPSITQRALLVERPIGGPPPGPAANWRGSLAQRHDVSEPVALSG